MPNPLKVSSILDFILGNNTVWSSQEDNDPEIIIANCLILNMRTVRFKILTSCLNW